MKVQNPWMGRTRKQAGGMVGYTMYGHNIMRAKPFEVRNPRTPAQQLQRARFTGLTMSANSLTTDELNLLFPATPVGRGRRSELQHQLAPAFAGAVVQGEYVAQFDPTKVDEIGNGVVGYDGDLIASGIANEAGISELLNVDILKIANNMCNIEDTDYVFIVAFDEATGSMQVIDSELTFNDFKAEASIEISNITSGYSAYLYAFGGKKLQLIGLGTFSVAERSARKGHNPNAGK